MEVLNSIQEYNKTITTLSINNIKYQYIFNSTDKLHYCESNEQSKDIINIINIILSNIKNIDISEVIDIIKKSSINIEKKSIIIDDKYNIFKDDSVTKWKINKALLWENYMAEYSKKSLILPDSIPNELKLSSKQIFTMIINEVDKVNSNMTYSHYIVFNNNDIFNLSIRFVYNSGELSDKMEQFNQTFGYNYFELNIILPQLYPFVPPSVSYIRPKIDMNLIANILNMDLWNINTWNSAITIEWIVCNLANALEPHFNTYLDHSNINNGLDKNPFDFIELKMIELHKISNISPSVIIPIELSVVKFTSDTTTNSPWKSGTGYGSGHNTNKWDITKYIESLNLNNDKTEKILHDIYEYINTNTPNVNEVFYKYIISKFDGINLLNYNKNIKIYKYLIEIMDIIIKYNDINFIKSINLITKNIYDEMKFIMSNETVFQSLEDIYMMSYLHFIDVIEKYNKIINITVSTTVISDDIKSKYLQMVRDNMFSEFELIKTHKYYEMTKYTISPKTIMRIMSEYSSLQKDLPVNWDSSVVMRYNERYSNLFSFIISGPKDTPYHNGLFEFHAYFPDGYPNVIPQVLLNTTDNGSVRFNPNLYENGKVCLSLLGTWHGDKGESWIPSISTFFQVIISIQSLIMVDEPYFNEPGYESSMNTEYGKNNSFKYTDNIRYQTVRVAMIGMLKNKPESYETFIEEHFKLKKDEIIETVSKWVDESLMKSKFQLVFDELKKLL